MQSLFLIALLFVFQCAYSTGSWSACTDLNQVKSDVAGIDDKLRALFSSQSIDISSTDVITVLSANCQVVNGMNYAVTTNFGVVGYHIAPSASAAPDSLSYIGSTSRITGGYSDYSDLDQVSTDLGKITSDIHSLLTSNDMDVADNDNIVVLSAQSQVVAGTNFKVHVNIGQYTNVILSYFIDLPSNDATQKPKNLKLIDAGTKRVGSYSDVSDLSQIQTQIDSIDAELRELLNNEGLNVDVNDTISVISAQSQIVAGTNYKVTINVGSYSNVIISYFVGLSYVIPPPITDLKVLDIGSGGNVVVGGWNDVTNADELAQVKATCENEIADQIVSLLQAAGSSIVDDAQIVVISAKAQIVAGTIYRVNLNVGAYTDVIIQYFLGLPLLVMGAPVNYPMNVQLIEIGTERANVGSFTDVSDLSAVQSTISSMDSDIRSLLTSEGLSVEETDSITVVSAQSQVVAGTNYRVTLNVGLHENVVISYFIDLPVNNPNQTPSNLKLIDLGIGGVDSVGSYQSVSDLDTVRADVTSQDADIRKLFVTEGILGEGENAAMVVVSATSQVVAGTNYKVVVNAGEYSNIVISYFVSLQGEISNLKLIDAGTKITDTLVGGYSDVSDLSVVKSQIESIDDELRSALVSKGFEVSDDDDISVISAESQIVAGTNYRVKISVGSNQKAMITYFVGLSDQTPKNLDVAMVLKSTGSSGSSSTSNMMGSYQSVSDLDAVKTKVATIKSEIISLLNNNQLDVSSGANIEVTSALSQVVSGTNYKVTLNIGSLTNVIIGYYIDLPVNDADQTPKNLHLIASGTQMVTVGSYTDVSDLSTVKTQVSSVESDILSLLSSQGLSYEDDDEISVVSAQSQVVAGTNYRVTMDIGENKNVIVQYFVDLPVNDSEQTPSNMKVIDLGQRLTLVDTPSTMETTVSLEAQAAKPDNEVSETAQWIIVGAVIGFIVFLSCAFVVLVLKRRNTKPRGNELYASLNNDAIDQSL